MNVLEFAVGFSQLDETTKNSVRKLIFQAYSRANKLYMLNVKGAEVHKEFKSAERLYKASCNKSLITLLWDSAPESLKREYQKNVAGNIGYCPTIYEYIVNELGGDNNELCENDIEKNTTLIAECKKFIQHISKNENSVEEIIKRSNGYEPENDNSDDTEETDSEEQYYDDIEDEVEKELEQESERDNKDEPVEECDDDEEDFDDNGEDYDDDEEDFDDPELIGAVNRVMAVMKDLYEVGFELKPPAGVLTKDGMVYVRKNGSSHQLNQSSLSKIYSMINRECGNRLVQSEVETGKSKDKIRNLIFRRGTTYYPEYVLGNALGITSSIKVGTWRELEESLRKEIKYVLKDEINKGVDVQSIVDAFTTGIIISEYDPNSCIKLRIAVAGNSLQANSFQSGYMSMQRDLFGGSSKLGRCTAVGSGVVEVDIILDEVAYNGKPLFAYEAVKALLATGRTPSISNAILGQDSSGRILTTNLTAQDHSITLIGAGQRSGKGVLTLNLLGAILSSGSPLVYMDSKPDMSVVIREIGEKYNIKPACWDSNNSFGNKLGKNAPSEVKAKLSGLFGKLVYLKVVQLMMVVAHLSMEGKKIFTQTPFFIFDEALALQQTLKANWNTMMGHTGKKEDGELADWCKHIADWGDTVQGDLAGTINSQLPASGVCTIWLFQSMQPSNWSAQSAKGLSGSFNPFKDVITSRMSTKLMGRGTYDSEYALLNIKGVPELKNKIDNRWFAKSNSQKISGPDDVNVFKPYLVLNYAENGKGCVEAFKKNVGADVWKNLAPNGSLDPAAGLEGYIDLLGKGAISNLGLGMKLLNDLMEVTGLSRKYEDIEDYLYDASAESFHPLQILKNGEIGIDGAGAYGNNEDSEDIDTDYINLAPDLSKDTGYGQNKDEFVIDNQDVKINEPLDLFGYNEIGSNSDDSEFEDYEVGSEQVKDEEPEITYNKNGIPNIPEDELIDIGITPEQLKKVLEYIEVGKQKSFVDSKGYNVTDESDKYKTPVNNSNTIDCTRTERVKINWAKEKLMGTVLGTDIYLNTLFDNILKEVASNFRSSTMVKRFAVLGNSMWANGLHLNLNGIIGGAENILVEDIFSVKKLFKRFKSITDLELDTNILSNALMEIGNGNPYSLFSISKSLRKIRIHSGNKVEVLDRFGKGYGELSKDAKNKATLEAAGAVYSRKSFGESWRENTSGRSIWGRNVMNRGLNYAGGALGGDKVKPIRGILAAVGGVSLGAIGAIGWFGFNLIRTAKGVWDNSKR